MAKIKELEEDELTLARKEIATQKEANEKLSAELILVRKELVFQDEEKGKRAAESGIADKELAYQDEEKGKRAAELIIANYARSLIEASLDPLVTISVAGKILDVNEASVKVTGVPREKLINTDFSNYFTEPRKAQEGYRQVFEKGFVADYPLTIKHKNGNLTDVLYNASVYKDDKGNVLGVFAAARDVTEQKWVKDLRIANKELAFQNDEKEKRAAELGIANKELNQSERLLKESLKEVSDYKDALDDTAIIALTDQKGIIRKANANFCKISKYSEEELIGQDHRLLSSGYHPKEFIHDLWETIANGKIWKGEIKNKAKDGSFYWVDTTIVPFLNEQGKPYQYLAIRVDITNRKESEEQLKTVNIELAFQNNEKEKRAIELGIANKELLFQNDEKEKRAAELGIANKELIFQNDEKEKRAAELGIANKNLVFENEEKEKRAAELAIANKELAFQNEEKEKRAAELIIAKYARSLIEASLDPLVTISAEGKILDVNEASVKVTGVPREKLINTDFSNYFTEPRKAQEGYRQVFEKGFVADYPLTIKHKNGNLTDVLYNASVYKDDKGNVLGVFAAARDVTEQKKSSQYARSLIEASLDPLVTISVTGKILDVNEASVKVTGVPREKLINTDFSNYFTEPRKAQEGYRQVFEKGFVADYPLTIKHKNGNLTDVLYNASVYKDDKGNVLGVFAAARDVTEQKKSSQYARSLIEASLDPLVTISVTGKILDVNEASVKVTGVPREKLINTDFSNYFTEPRKAQEGYRQVFEKGFVADYPLTIKHKNGNLTDVLYNASVYKDDKGNVLGVFAAARDVTEQKWAKDLRIANKELAFQNVEKEKRTAELGIANKKLVFENEEKEKRAAELGIANKELIFQNDEKEKRAAELGIANKKLVFENEEKEKRAAELVIANKELAFQNEEKGKRAAELGIANKELAFQNIEKEKRAAELGIANKKLVFENEEKEKRAAELVIANKELLAFTYISSHDLQEPLRKIQTFVSIISSKEDKNLTENGKYNFQRIQLAAGRMQLLIDDLLAFSRIATTELKFEKTELGIIIEDVKAELKDTISEKHATIEAIELCEANIIPFQFRQLLYNLISNALKFSNPEKQSHIIISSRIEKGSTLDNEKLSPRKSYCHITIKDNGIGFEPHFSERIFGVFQKLHSKETYAGTGIGLAIVKKIVENHNGIITAKSELKKGATFDIYIPTN